MTSKHWYDKKELIGLYHTAQVALAGELPSCHARMCWAASSYGTAHITEGATKTGAYIALEAIVRG